MAAGGLRSILSRTGSVRLAGCCHSLLSTPCAGAPQKRYWHQGTARFCVSRIFEKHMSNTRRPCQAEPALQGRAGAVRGLAQDDGSFKTAGGGIRASPFEEDCRVVEECSSLVNARLDIPGFSRRDRRWRSLKPNSNLALLQMDLAAAHLDRLPGTCATKCPQNVFIDILQARETGIPCCPDTLRSQEQKWATSKDEMAVTMMLELLKARLAELDGLVSDPKLYDDSTRAGKIVKERAQVEASLERVERLPSELQMWREMYEMAALEEEGDLIEECTEKVSALRKEAERARAEVLLALGGDLSSHNCYLELQAGAGGTESHDWTNMLFKMYSGWAEARGFTIQPVNSYPGDEVGLRSVMVFVEGASAYGWLRTEAGVHRLVRNSPYDPTGRRHTSFSQVRVFPEADSGPGGAQGIEIPAKDLKIDTMRAQGAGGQHVNTTDSAVRITHIPTKLVALSQSDRSQHRNRETAMRALKAKIFQREEEDRRTKRNEYASDLGDNAFGNQIRSYVLSPYQMVKDHRTGMQEGDVASVLDGEIDAFIDAALTAEHTNAAEREHQESRT